MEERLQKILSGCGICSRRAAEEFICGGRVSINGVTARLGDRADPERDGIALDGKPIPCAAEKVYLMLNKPRGYVTTLSDERGRRTAADLVKGCGTRVWPVGRLDLQSEGLLLFTNDGEFTQKLLHPSGDVEKEYLLRVAPCDDDVPDRLRGEFILDGKRLCPAKVRVIRKSEDNVLLRVTVHEGKNRQLRRMCDIAGCTVLRLKRIREGSLVLGDLKAGEWRYLRREEIAEILDS